MQSGQLYSMLTTMLADVDKELVESGADAEERVVREREVYGLAATELCRQLRVESKARAALVEKVLDRAWGLTDEVLPVVAAHAASRKRAWAERDAALEELKGTEGAEEVLRARVASVELSLWTARRRAAAAVVKLMWVKRKHGELVSSYKEACKERDESLADAVAKTEAFKAAKWRADELDAEMESSRDEIAYLSEELRRLEQRRKTDVETM